jgi:hypothetical protein
MRRRVATCAGDFDYAWLVPAVGIRHDYAARFGNDARPALTTR